jgi:hypothetical protein
MPTYKTNDGETIRGATAAEVIADLRAKSFAPENSKAAFMRGVAARVVIQCSGKVRVHRDEQFVADLVALGLLVPAGD